MRKYLLLFLIVCLTVSVVAIGLVGCDKYEVDYNSELILNGNLENRTTDWTFYTDSNNKLTPTVVDIKNGDSTTYFEEHERHGGSYISITATSTYSYGYYSQTVPVEKDAKYLLKADVKITDSIESDGVYKAFIGLAESTSIFRSVEDQSDGWYQLEVAFYNYSYDSVNVRFGIGTDSSTFLAGTALFDNISLMKIADDDAVGLVALNLGSKGASGYDSGYLTDSKGIVFTVLLTVLGAALLYALYVFVRRYSSRSLPTVETVGEEVKNDKTAIKGIVFSVIAVLAAFAIRLVLVITLYGHGAIMNQLATASESMANNGVIKYYFEYTPYFTPGVSYLLWIMGLIAKSLNLLSGTQGFALFMKIPSVIADLLTVYFIYAIAAKKTDPVKAFVIALAYALLPVAFIASSVYGSFACIGALFLLLAFNAARDRKIIKLTVFYSLAVLFVAEALILLPLLLTYAVVLYVKYPEYRNVLPISMTVAIIGGYLVTLPLTWSFFITGKPFIVLERYFTIFSESKLFVDGAFNVYTMCALSGADVNTAGVVMSAILVACIMLAGIGLYIKCRDRQKLTLIAAYVLLFTYTFCIRMSIFVVLPALLLFYLYAVYSGERRVLTTTAAASVIVTLSACYELMICKYVPGGLNAQEVAVSAHDPVAITFSAVFVLITLISGFVVMDICLKGREKTVRAIPMNYCKYLLSFFKKEKVEEEAVEEE
ncbi:MAG: hypothetical protein IJS93_02785 [Clostridia bacterium]|nr:hypothetical protein [Clostridia bacterium]